MKRPKRILEEIPKEDLDIMKEANKMLTVEKSEDWEKTYEPITKTQAKEELGEQYFRWLERATFHMTAIQEKDWAVYYFKTKYCFI